MGKIKPIGITFSDLHTAKWKQFNEKQERTLQPYSIIKIIAKEAKKYNVPVLFPGDWNDHPKHMDNEVMQVQAANTNYLRKKKIKVYGIDGNHDFSKVNSIEKNIRGFFSHLSALCPDVFFSVNFKYYDTKHFRVHGIPYLNGNADYDLAMAIVLKNLSKSLPNILIIHRDLPGAVEPNGKCIGDMDDQKSLKKAFKNFELVLSGHIHKPQKVDKLGNHVYMVGATNQQRRSDAGTKMGYWIIMSDFSMKFVDLEEPEFKYYNEGEDVDLEDGNYWIKLPPEAKIGIATSDDNKFQVTQKRDTLVENYFKVKGIKNKKKLHLLKSLLND